MREDKKKGCRALIVSGGRIEPDFALQFIEDNTWDCLIGADRGIEFLRRVGFTPTHIVGDFDSSGEEALAYFREKGQSEIYTFCPEKDLTDTQIAVELAMKLRCDNICILGGNGARVDHMLANIRILALPARSGIECFLVDAHNRIRLLNRGIRLRREELFGDYVSFFALGETVRGVTLKGFRYPLNDYNMTGTDPIGVSNELTGEAGEVSFDNGMLLMVESRDENH